MTQVKPFIKCIDYWPEMIPPEKLAAYKALIDDGQIRAHHVLVNRHTGASTIEYYAAAPHEWILEELKKRSEQYATMSVQRLRAEEVPLSQQLQRISGLEE